MNYFNFVITHSRNELEKELWTLTFIIDWDNNEALENVFETSMTLNSTFTRVFTMGYIEGEVFRYSGSTKELHI